MSKLGVHLGARKHDWDEYAKQRGRTPSLLAAMVLKQILDSEKAGAPIFKIEQQKEWGVKKPLKLMLYESELQALDAFVEHDGTTRQGFVIGVIRAHMANEPQYSTEEILALRESNAQLRKIGVNLNAIAKRLNQGHLETSGLNEVLNGLQSMIEQHTSMVSQTINPGFMRYRIKRG
ncbi:MAG: plasmid mobilization relaxosome protein MobC [Formosimonas sp.]